MYVTDAIKKIIDVKPLRDAKGNSKELGNFNNLVFYAPNGKLDGIKIMLLSDVATKDDFSSKKSKPLRSLECPWGSSKNDGNNTKQRQRI